MLNRPKAQELKTYFSKFPNLLTAPVGMTHTSFICHLESLRLCDKQITSPLLRLINFDEFKLRKHQTAAIRPADWLWRSEHYTIFQKYLPRVHKNCLNYRVISRKIETILPHNFEFLFGFSFACIVLVFLSYVCFIWYIFNFFRNSYSINFTRI